MILGAPHIVERDGQQVLVDERATEVVCRIKADKHSSRVFHRVDLAAFQEDGTIQPDCEVANRAPLCWELLARDALEPLWRGCTFPPCFGGYDGASKHRQDQSLTNRLKHLSVEEFDEIVEQR